MCGILGLLAITGKLDTARFGIPNDTEVLKHRGPDDHGHFLEGQVYFGHRRLSIIDLSTGKQPIFNEDHSLCVILNGEVFNYKTIKAELESKGHVFRTNSDTEVIVHAFEEWGQSCVNRFRGMFAFAIWDAASQALFLARDRLGIKPLCYALVDGVFYFASEMKALLQYPFFPRKLDLDALGAYFTLSYIPAPSTIYRDIKKLPAGHTLSVREGQVSINRYWDVHFNPDYSHGETYLVERFNELFTESIGLRLISDVPLGAFLSGGIDSSAVVARMAQIKGSSPVRTFTIGFGGNIGAHLDERKYARAVATRYHTAHTEYEVTPLFGEALPAIVRSFDEPFADAAAIPSYYISKTAAAHVKVVLSGLGGDEMFGGYDRYVGYKLGNLYNWLPRFFRRGVVLPLVDALPERADGHYTISRLKRFARSAGLGDSDRYLGLCSILRNIELRDLLVGASKRTSDFCRELFANHFTTADASSALDRIAYCDLKTWVPEDILMCTDRMSMWHGLEVRVPFLDHKLVEFCATIPPEMKIRLSQKKYLLRKAVSDQLPRGVLRHRKQGFIGPMALWLRNELRQSVLEILSRPRLDRHGLLEARAVERILRDSFERKELNDKIIWSLIAFQCWFEEYMV